MDMLGSSAEDRTILVIQLNVLSRCEIPLLIFHNESDTWSDVREVSYWVLNENVQRLRIKVMLKQRTSYDQKMSLSKRPEPPYQLIRTTIPTPTP